MKSACLRLGISILAFSLYGCATPSGMKWQKTGYSAESTNADIQDCKVSTALWWPFDDLSKCMHRRGYKLIGLNEIPANAVYSNVVRNEQENETYRKLVELKKLKDSGIISEEEFESKKVKYLSKY